MYTHQVNFIERTIDPMHELPVTESILKIALKHANEANAKRIENIHIVMGELSTNVDDSVQFYWDIIAKDTLAEGAQLLFRRVPAEMQCQSCSEKFHPEDDYVCPQCGGAQVKIIAGEEFYVEAIDID
jgi:hydrogenase nickel incorporation protein HypA/HybF